MPYLALDGMGEVDPKEADDVAYMLANGQGKTRAGKYGEMRLPASWRFYPLAKSRSKATLPVLASA